MATEKVELRAQPKPLAWAAVARMGYGQYATHHNLKPDISCRQAGESCCPFAFQGRTRIAPGETP